MAFYFLEIRGEQVRLGIIAPSQVPVYREELYEKIKEINVEAVKAKDSLFINPLKSTKGGEEEDDEKGG